jgi:catechol 2,3-dioxygenase-like lactoylglutathione lyase family enzyme
MTMLTRLTNVNVWVHDQDEALAFYTEKLGMELREDVTVPEMGNFRWLTVGVPGQPDVALALMAIPGPPVFAPETSEQIRTLMAKGAAGGLFFATDDVRASYEELKSRGVEFQQEPTEMRMAQLR